VLAELPRFPFNRDTIASAPEDTGVFVLWEGTEITRVGLAPSPEGGIKAELLALIERRNVCSCTPTHYSWLFAREPLTVASELLREHSRHFRDLPRCNREHG
jgi:hypothetical protein